MTRLEFIHLAALPGKRIDQDFVFDSPNEMHPNRILRSVDVFNTAGWKIKLEGHYNSFYDSITFNFICSEAGGPICRVDVRGAFHKQQGRTHKHDIHNDADPRKNLPTAHSRADLEMLTPQQVWADLCQRANIQHTGTFANPNVPEIPIGEGQT